MKAIILAGGLGTRIFEETDTKPMIEMGGKPILGHIMKMYSTHGVNIGNPSYPISQAFEALTRGL
jgi:glucose-1-phosphate cytidylyltransferase